MPKFVVYWWIRANGKTKQGHDIIVSEDSEFNVDSAETLIDSDLLRDVPMGSGRFPSGFESQNQPTNLPVFYANHKQMRISSKHYCISNWGVRKVIEKSELKVI